MHCLLPVVRACISVSAGWPARQQVSLSSAAPRAVTKSSFFIHAPLSPAGGRSSSDRERRAEYKWCVQYMDWQAGKKSGDMNGLAEDPDATTLEGSGASGAGGGGGS